MVEDRRDNDGSHTTSLQDAKRVVFNKMRVSFMCILASTLQRSRGFAVAFLVARPVFSAVDTCPSSSRRSLSTTTAAETPNTATSTSKTFLETSTAYKQLLDKLQTITNLQRASSCLSYDQMVFMPAAARASAARGAQLAALASVIHAHSTDASVKELIEKAEADLKAFNGSSAKEEATILALTREDFEKMQKIPSELEARRAALSAKGYRAWMEARQANDFGMFESTLKECFDTAAETAECLRDDPSKSLYTTMLNEFERGMSAERIDELFTEIENALKPLLKDVLASPHQQSTECLEKDIPIEKQQQLSRQIVTKLGFDDSHGRIDVSPHPFSMSLSPADVRITSRFNNREWYSGLAGTIHEAGHAMYEQGLGESGTSVDSFLSMGCHESQSLFWERHVGLSKPFWKYASLAVKNVLGIEVEPDEVYAAVNKVTPGFIRVDADELTYPLHVILRYRLERDVMEGKASVSDIPSKWNQAMKDMLDVNVDSDANGCLQDVHW